MYKNIFIILCLQTLLTYSQDRNVAFKNGVFNNNLEFFAMAKVNSKNNSENSIKVKGHYYLNKNKWRKCTIETVNNKIYNYQECNYNIYDKRFEFIIEEELYFLKQHEIKSIIINNEKFIPFKTINVRDKNYYREIYKLKNKDKLIEIYILNKKSVPSSTTLGLYHNKVSTKTKRYLLTQNKIIELPKRKKEILKLFNKKYNAKSHRKLKIKKDIDLIKLVE